jgi:hypothetical protein
LDDLDFAEIRRFLKVNEKSRAVVRATTNGNPRLNQGTPDPQPFQNP